MTAAERVAASLARIPTVRSETGVFVSMDGPLAVVNMGGGTVTIPCVGFYPPAVGMVVQVEWRDGRPAVTGPASPLNPLGEVTGSGSPTATVEVDGVSYDLYYRDGYTPQVGDTVEINWATGIIQGKVTGTTTPDPPDTTPPPAAAFTLVVKAADSRRYQSGSWRGGKDVWSSGINKGIWVYGNRIRDAIKDATVTRLEVFLPLVKKRGSSSIGTHSHATIPSGAPSISNLQTLGKMSGWVQLPLSFATYLAVGGRGIGVSPPSDWLNEWLGVDRDSDSGALRFTGTR